MKNFVVNVDVVMSKSFSVDAENWEEASNKVEAMFEKDSWAVSNNFNSYVGHTIIDVEEKSNRRDFGNNCNTLEEILQVHFGCLEPFGKDGRLTDKGANAYKTLETLLNELHSLGVITNSDYSRKLDEITNDNI